ncbi:hypothetical protein BaRGS_00026260 [Batillaria attramentaria]|uniref:Uncharacterized protein n=1 Tax=Batillaria attramentaria TaxID=370345 RepID=A0ABD0K6D8_9CAEN
MGPDSSVSNFSLKVTTPSDLKVQRLPADHIVTSASPDSSSDNKNAGGSPQSSSVQLKIDNGKSGDTSADVDSPKVKVEQDSKIPSRSQLASSEDDKDSGYSGERCPSNDSRSVSTEGSLASPMETEESTELFLYKHKKFGAHRKRTGSNDVPEPDAKQARVEASGVDSSTSSSQKSDSNIEYTSTCEDEDTSVTGSASIKLKSEVSTKSARPGFVASGDGVGSGAKKTEARHHMPCVLERVLRSQAGRNARTTDNS